MKDKKHAVMNTEIGLPQETEDGARIVYVAAPSFEQFTAVQTLNYDNRVQSARVDALRFSLETQYKRMPDTDEALEDFDFTEDLIEVAQRIEQYLLTGV